ncbi:MAG: hypothetical protein V4638_09740 [Bacteroidota bacterium]
MKIRQLLIVLLLIFPLMVVAQSKKKKKPKNSQAQGTLYGYWGYNRTTYTKSNLHFVGEGYDFSLAESKAKDNPSPFSLQYFNPKFLTVPQFNLRVGYYIKNHWAISFGYDHMKYIFKDRNQVLLSGTIDPGVDNVTNWSGTFNDSLVITDRNTFHYENSNGLNFLRVGFERTDNLFGLKNWFVLSSHVGVSTGGLLTFNDFTFAGKKDMVTISLSGYGMAASAGVRLEFFKHVFIQSNLTGGFNHLLKVKTRPDDASAYARQFYGYSMWDTSIGFLLYIRPTNSCKTCPTW